MTPCHWCPLMNPPCEGCTHQPEPIEGQGDLLEAVKAETERRKQEERGNIRGLQSLRQSRKGRKS